MEPFVGEIRMFAGPYAPQGWAYCNGQLLTISEYSALFSLLGVTYGGNGTSTFALPDLRGRVPLGFGQRPSFINYMLGQKGGSEGVALEVANLPSHTHTMYACTAEATSPAFGPIQQFGECAPGTRAYLPVTATGATDALMHEKTISDTGASAPHYNLMPCFAINYIIALNGLYPQAA